MTDQIPAQAELLLDPPLAKQRRQVFVPAGQTLRAALNNLNLNPVQPVIALVNGTVHDLSYRLQPGDRVRFLAQISGGAS